MVKLRYCIQIKAPVERCFDLARSIEVHALRNQHCNAPARAVAGLMSGLAGLGQQTTWKARHFFLWHNLTSEITALRAPVYFQSSMRKGVFKSMQHGHYFAYSLPARSRWRIYLASRPHFRLGCIVETLLLRRYMQSLLEERSLVIKEVAESDEWVRYLPMAENA